MVKLSIKGWTGVPYLPGGGLGREGDWKLKGQYRRKHRGLELFRMWQAAGVKG